MQKETFIIRTEWYDAIAEMETTDQATIFRNLFAYHADGEIVLDTFPVRIVWKLIVSTLERNIETYDRRRETAIENGKKGGRGNKSQKYDTESENKPTESENKPKNPTLFWDKTQKPIESLCDNVYVYDSVSVSVIDSEDVLKNSQPIETEKIKYPAELALPAPSPGNNADAVYYEQEICMRHSITPASLTNIHTAWVGDRTQSIFTRREARQNFASYCAKWKENNRNREQYRSPTPQSTPQYTPIYEPSG